MWQIVENRCLRRCWRTMGLSARSVRSSHYARPAGAKMRPACHVGHQARSRQGVRSYSLRPFAQSDFFWGPRGTFGRFAPRRMRSLRRRFLVRLTDVDVTTRERTSRQGGPCSPSSLRDEHVQVRLRDSDDAQDSRVRQVTTRAEFVDGRRADAELACDGSDREQILLDPSWTPRFVFLRCAMENSRIGSRRRTE